MSRSVSANGFTLYLLNGRIVVSDVPPTDGIPLEVSPSAAELGVPLSNPTAPSVYPHNEAGTTSYSYYVVARDSAGNQTLASSAGSITTGNATLDYINYNFISWFPVAGAASYDVLKGDTSTLLGSTRNNYYADIGQTTSSYVAASVNSTGNLSVEGNATVTGLLTVVGPVATLYLEQAAGSNPAFRWTLNNDGHIYLQRSTDNWSTVDEGLAFGPDGFQIMPWGGSLGFFGATPVGKPTVTGSKGGNLALASLITALASYGLIVDSTT